MFHDLKRGKTRKDLIAIAQHKSEKEWMKTLKQFNNMNWEWVDDIPTLVIGTHKEPDYRGAE